MFVCHGNICRSPMAEFIFKDMVAKLGRSDEFYVASSATSYEEIGNAVHRGTRAKLAQHGISTEGKYAIRMTKEDYENYDYIIGMDSMNIRNILHITGGDPDGKIHKLKDYSGSGGDVSDPWYSDRFDIAYRDIYDGCLGLMRELMK
mgnify:CR=1 FL=1